MLLEIGADGHWAGVTPGVEFPPPTDEPTMADFGWIKFAIFPAVLTILFLCE